MQLFVFAANEFLQIHFLQLNNFSLNFQFLVKQVRALPYRQLILNYFREFGILHPQKANVVLFFNQRAASIA